MMEEAKRNKKEKKMKRIVHGCEEKEREGETESEKETV